MLSALCPHDVACSQQLWTSEALCAPDGYVAYTSPVWQLAFVNLRRPSHARLILCPQQLCPYFKTTTWAKTERISRINASFMCRLPLSPSLLQTCHVRKPDCHACRRNSRLRASLDVEEPAGGPPQPSNRLEQAESVEAAAHRVKGEGLWELGLLKRHYHRPIATVAASMAAILPEGECREPECVCLCLFISIAPQASVASVIF